MEHTPTETIDSVQQLPIKALPDRGIKKETCEHFGVRVGLSEKDGRTIESIYFPITDGGKLVAYKKRDLTKPKGAKNHFTFVGSASVDCDLFGQAQCQSGGKKLITTEGEIDTLATWQILKDHFPQANPNVTSIIMGTGNAAKNIAYNEKFCNGFKEKILCFDQDRATEEEKEKGIVKGYDAVTEVCAYNPDWLHTSFSEKDPNDMLLAGKGEELYWAIVKHSQKHVPDEVMKGGEIGLDALTRPLEKGVYLQNFPGLMDKMKGLRRGELTLILAPPGAGKTSVCREWDYALMTSGKKVAKIFLEESVEKTHQGLLALDNNVFLPRFRENPSIVPKADLQKSYDKLIDNDRCYFYRHKRGRVDHDSLMKAIRWFATIGGCDYVILDHLTLVFSGSEQKDERKEIDMTMTLLGALAEELKIHLAVVAHIKRMNKAYVKDEFGAEWLLVDQDSARGSGSFEQISWNIVCLEPEKTEDGQRGRIRNRLTKNREWGYLGVGDVQRMDPETGRLVDASTESEF